MADKVVTADDKVQHSSQTIFAWIAILVASPLDLIIWRQLFTAEPSWWIWVKVLILLILLGTTVGSSVFRPLLLFVVLLLTILLLEGIGFPLVRETPLWTETVTQSWMSEAVGNQVLRLGVSLAVLAILFLAGFQREDFFLVKGRVDAQTDSVRAIGVKEGESWRKTGRNFSLIVVVVTFLVLVFTARPETIALAKLAPLIPVVLLAAAMNSFNEELPYRASLLSQLTEKIGNQHALLMTAASFGLVHFYGTPSGVIGVLLAGFIGWFLGASMLDTGGFWWAWFIHFLLDVVIFGFSAAALS
jgi:hypothetical protein